MCQIVPCRTDYCCIGQMVVLDFLGTHYCLKVSLVSYSILIVYLFIVQLLISYGDAGTKGALTDEHVFASAKCQVYFFIQHLFFLAVAVFYF